MGRKRLNLPPKVAVTVRFAPDEAAMIDLARDTVNRDAWIRAAALRSAKRKAKT